MKLRTRSKFFEKKEKHHFHIVDNSQLPVVTAVSAASLLLNFVFYWHPTSVSILYSLDNIIFEVAWVQFLSVIFGWFLSVLSESGQGHHTRKVHHGLRWGVVLFIVSEVMFFFAFFWAFFHVSLSPAVAIGCVWPPKGIQELDVWGLPLINTVLLLYSGLTITLTHRDILEGDVYTSVHYFNKHLLATIILGIVFLCCQCLEYKYGVTFRWKENIYGSTFFVTTGFHGLHVTIGTIFLLFCLIRSLMTTINISKLPCLNWLQPIINYLSYFSFRKEQHLGFEASAWYWHFVDVVWIFLFITVYWWGS